MSRGVVLFPGDLVEVVCVTCDVSVCYSLGGGWTY